MAAGRLVWSAFMPARDSDGFPLPDALMYFYLNNTTTLATIYADEALTTPLSNPVPANSSGNFPTIWADTTAVFSASIASPTQGQIATIDDLTTSTTGGGGGTVTFATQAEIQAGTVSDEAIAPDQAFLGMPVHFRSIEISTQPSPRVPNGSGGIANAFNGDQSGNAGRIKSLLTGTALGAPATGYLYTEETIPERIYFVNRSGHNQATDSNIGRTGAVAHRVSVTANQTVQGDSIAYGPIVSVGGAKPGATNFLANPAGALMAGDVIALNSGVYLNARETNLLDSGFDVAAIGDVVNLNRTNNTGALGATWAGYRPQSQGTLPVDAFYSMRGPSRIGMDFSTGTLTEAAATLGGNQRIYMNATNASANGFPRDTVTGDEYFTYNTTTQAFEFAKDGAVVASVGTSGIQTDLKGNGSPEGVVTAEPGMTYRQLDGANGSTLWEKRAGIGNTNWGTLGSQPTRTLIAKAGIIVSEGFLITGLVGGVARRLVEYLSSGVMQLGDSAAGIISVFNDLVPDVASGAKDLGSSSNRWDTIYLINSPDISSDAREKTEVETPLSLLAEIRRLPMRSYKRNDGGLIRCGVFAQDVIACFDRAGVDWREWDVVAEDDEGRLSVYYDHLFALKIAALEAAL